VCCPAPITDEQVLRRLRAAAFKPRRLDDVKVAGAVIALVVDARRPRGRYIIACHARILS
jgi:hypothetical protein